MTGIAKIAVILTGLAAAVAGIPVGAQPDRAQIKADYLATTAQLNQHVLTGGLLDDAAESATLLGRQWALAAQWVAVSLDRHGPASVEAVKAAVLALDPKATPEAMVLV